MNAWRWVFGASENAGTRVPITAITSSISTSRRVPVNDTPIDGADSGAFDDPVGLST